MVSLQSWELGGDGEYSSDLARFHRRIVDPVGSSSVELWEEYKRHVRSFDIRREVERLRHEVHVLRASLQVVQPRVIMVRQLTEDEAVREIEAYLRDKGMADSAELVVELGLDIDVVQRVLRRLKEEGKVEVID